MMERRRFVKKKPENPPKEIANTSTLELSFSNPDVSNQSLLIHDDQDDVYDIFSDSHNGQPITDSDIPLEKLNILNNPNYFKQLSLSFYGTARTVHRSNTVQADNNNHYAIKTEGDRTETSNSPKPQKDAYYVGIKRPTLYKKIERDSFQLNFTSFTKSFQRPHLSLSSSKMGPQRPKDKSLHESSEAKGYMNLSKADFRPFRINNKPSSNLPKNIMQAFYPQIASGANSNTMLSAKTSSRRSGFFEKEILGSSVLKESRRPSVKNSISSKLKSRNAEYLLTEPNSCMLKVSKSSAVVPKKLKMYALDNLGMINPRNSVGVEGKLSTNRSISRDKVPIRPSVTKKVTEIGPKRSIVTFKQPGIKRNTYYE